MQIEKKVTNLVSFLTAVEADLRLWTLVNLVAFLPAPPTLLGLRAVSGHVTLLGNIIKSTSAAQRGDRIGQTCLQFLHFTGSGQSEAK